MKKPNRLFVLLSALAFCLALLTVPAAAETNTYQYNGNKLMKSKKPWSVNTIVVDFGSAPYLSCDGSPMRYGSVMKGNTNTDYDVMLVDMASGSVQFRVQTTFLDKLNKGIHTFRVTGGPDEGKTFEIDLVFDKEIESFPPATPTDLDGGSDEPDEVLYFGGMSGAGAASTGGGKAPGSEAAAAVSAGAAGQAAPAQTATVSAAILPENADAPKNPSTGAAL